VRHQLVCPCIPVDNLYAVSMHCNQGLELRLISILDIRFMPHSEQDTSSSTMASQVNGETPSSAFLSARHSLQLPHLITDKQSSICSPTQSSPTVSAPTRPTHTAPNPSNSHLRATRSSASPSSHTSPSHTNMSPLTSRKPIPLATPPSPQSTANFPS
jgi:hypothetical protein